MKNPRGSRVAIASLCTPCGVIYASEKKHSQSAAVGVGVCHDVQHFPCRVCAFFLQIKSDTNQLKSSLAFCKKISHALENKGLPIFTGIPDITCIIVLCWFVLILFWIGTLSFLSRADLATIVASQICLCTSCIVFGFYSPNYTLFSEVWIESFASFEVLAKKVKCALRAPVLGHTAANRKFSTGRRFKGLPTWTWLDGCHVTSCNGTGWFPWFCDLL